MDEAEILDGALIDTPEKCRVRVALRVTKRALRVLAEARVWLTLQGQEVECRAYTKEARSERGVWVVPCDAGLYAFFAMQAVGDEAPADTILRVAAEFSAPVPARRTLH